MRSGQPSTGNEDPWSGFLSFWLWKVRRVGIGHLVPGPLPCSLLRLVVGWLQVETTGHLYSLVGPDVLEEHTHEPGWWGKKKHSPSCVVVCVEVLNYPIKNRIFFRTLHFQDSKHLFHLFHIVRLGVSISPTISRYGPRSEIILEGTLTQSTWFRAKVDYEGETP